MKANSVDQEQTPSDLGLQFVQACLSEYVIWWNRAWESSLTPRETKEAAKKKNAGVFPTGVRSLSLESIHWSSS